MILCWFTWLLVYCFLFVSFGHTQWLQPLHRTKKKTGDSACLSLLFLCLLVCLFVWSLVCFLAYCFLFVSFGHTQWLQPLHRTKKKTGDTACLFLFVPLFVRLLTCLITWYYYKYSFSLSNMGGSIRQISGGVQCFCLFHSVARLFFFVFKLSMWSVKECYTLWPESMSKCWKEPLPAF